MEALAMQLMNVASDMVGSGELISAATIPKNSVEGGADVFGRLLKGCTSMEEVATEGDSPPPVDTRQAITGQRDQELVMQQEVVAGMMAAVLQVPMAEARQVSQVSSTPEKAEAREQSPVLAVQQDQSPVGGKLPQVQLGGDVSHDHVVPKTSEKDMQRQAAAYGSALSMVAESVPPKGVENSRNDVDQLLKQPFQRVVDQEAVDTPQQTARTVETSAVGNVTVQKSVDSDPRNLPVTPNNVGADKGVGEVVVRQTMDRDSITITAGESPEVVFSQEPVLLVEQEMYSKSGTDKIDSRASATQETVTPETTRPVVSGEQVIVRGKNDTLMDESISEVSAPPMSAEVPVQVEMNRKTTGRPEVQQQAVALEVQEGAAVDEVTFLAETHQEEQVPHSQPVFVRQGVTAALPLEQQQNRRVALSPSDATSVVEQTILTPATEVAAVSSPSFEGGGADDQSLQKPLSEAVIEAEIPSGIVSQAGETPRFSTTVSQSESQSTLEELPEKIMHEVHQRFSDQNTLASGKDHITIRLTPEHLGEVKLTIVMEGQQLSVEIMSDNPQARDTIMQYADSLKESLSRQNINLDSFEVTSQDRGSGGFARGRDEWRQFSANQNNLWLSGAGYVVPKALAAQLPSDYGGITNNSMIDLHF